MTLVEIRAKARRLKQRVGLKMIVIDYLQLMTAGKRVESRQQEVSEFSRALKLLAKELQVPVVHCLSSTVVPSSAPTVSHN
jgi:replicative DNA helicase